jgi:hypothetical protein
MKGFMVITDYSDPLNSTTLIGDFSFEIDTKKHHSKQQKEERKALKAYYRRV